MKMQSTLPVTIENSPALAEYLNVKEVILVRDDKLPQGGGKKRRSLEDYTKSVKGNTNVHVLSYVGSHTAYTLAKTLTKNKIILYGVQYPGGDYGNIMKEKLASMKNVEQTVGSKTFQTIKFYANLIYTKLITKKLISAIIKSRKFNFRENPGKGFLNKRENKNNAEDVFMSPGGSLGRDLQYESAAKQVEKKIKNNHTHYVAVASGDMLTAVQKTFSKAFGILTQPLLIRFIKALKLKAAKGLFPQPISERETIMREIKEKTGYLWDPVFMGSVFIYLKSQKKLPDKLCIWVSCPSDIKW